MTDRVCSDLGCGRRLSRGNRSGYCRSHRMRQLNADPEFREAHRERMRQLHADPEFREANREAVIDAAIRREQSFMLGLDDEAVIVFAAARDDGLSCVSARDVAMMDMEERGAALVAVA